MQGDDSQSQKKRAWRKGILWVFSDNLVYHENYAIKYAVIAYHANVLEQKKDGDHPPAKLFLVFIFKVVKIFVGLIV